MSKQEQVIEWLRNNKSSDNSIEIDMSKSPIKEISVDEFHGYIISFSKKGLITLTMRNAEGLNKVYLSPEFFIM